MARWDPLLLIYIVVSVCQSFRPVALSPPPVKYFFFFFFFSMEKGCCHIDVLKTFPGDTDCKYIYIPQTHIYICGFVV